MAYVTSQTLVTIAALALLTVALPEPIVLDLLGAGLAWVGLGIIYKEGRLSF